ncbi:substrate-binding domain-containing protein [Pseudomonas kermanshahensis]|uniref:Substrate-binding domain-containing protein n=1 Tax=Pseudomonas kermanshahensis TaxID=2745482 RepID=A0ABU8R036_9PSED
MIDLGHRDIAFVGRNSTYSVSMERLHGYMECLEKNGITPNPDWMIETAISLAGGKDGMSRLLDMDRRPTGVVCYNDLIATGALSELGNRGLKAGEDIALIGSDGVASSAYCNPPLTTVALEPERIGEVASEMLMKRLKNPDAPAMKFLLKPKLIVRKSCGLTRN